MKPHATRARCCACGERRGGGGGGCCGSVPLSLFSIPRGKGLLPCRAGVLSRTRHLKKGGRSSAERLRCGVLSPPVCAPPPQDTVKRVVTGIWKCGACRKTMAGACPAPRAAFAPRSGDAAAAALQTSGPCAHSSASVLAACITGGAYSLNTGGAATVKGTIRRLREAVDL
eukprot:COSAG02_NODE_2649_length_8330_cov_8.513605_6_plen_171_part_00